MTTPRSQDGRTHHLHCWRDHTDCAVRYIDGLEAQLAATRCPIGLDASPFICSAGTCHACLRSRLAAQRVPDDAALDRLVALAASPLANELNELQAAAITALRRQLAEARARKDGAYEERNRVVALVARLYPSRVTKTAIEGWSEDWHGCVRIDTPEGQLSWHFHDSQAGLFAGLAHGEMEYDGHTTAEKYQRIERLCDAIDAAMRGRDE